MRGILSFLVALSVSAIVATAVGGEEYQGCGTVKSWQGCTYFETYWPAEDMYLLPDTVQVQIGAELFASGELVYEEATCGGIPLLFLKFVNVRFGQCEPEDLGCGVVKSFGVDSGCYTWAPLEQPGQRILIDDLGGFASGDTVRAQGIRRALEDVCICGCGVLTRTFLSRCGEQSVTWGRIKAMFRN
ncbi:MAG: hypothetical protein ACE15D_18330 [Candidatus Eisenbacteria bacterium]